MWEYGGQPNPEPIDVSSEAELSLHCVLVTNMSW